ncbi:MAG TPA: hypothetical protein VLJ84_09515, partial [Usitatibacter sp.]|nr:hypothetical protein [Usitatibacter sp.]
RVPVTVIVSSACGVVDEAEGPGVWAAAWPAAHADATRTGRRSGLKGFEAMTPPGGMGYKFLGWIVDFFFGNYKASWATHFRPFKG